jgi:O-methyltransferase involved in polyketide biosynthesis
MAIANVGQLGSVQKTLLLPLWGRAVETRKPRPLLMDPAAVRIIETMDYDFSVFAARMSFVTQLAWIARSLHIDRTIRQFLGRHPAATIVNLGCGLDTTFERVDNAALRWYDLDLPDVIELRSRYLRPGPRRRFVAASILEDAWLDLLAGADAVLFIAAGLLYYFEEAQVRTVLRKFADRCPGSQIVFDACSPRGLQIANKRVIEDGGMDASARLRWALVSAAAIRAWDPRISVLAEYPIFRGVKAALTWKEKWGTFLSDVLRVMSIVHLRLGVKDKARGTGHED